MLLYSSLILGVSLLGPSLTSAITISTSKTRASQDISKLTTSEYVLTLNRMTPLNGYNARSAAHLMGKSRAVAVSNNTSILESLAIGEIFATNITFGTQTFELIVDTGSSDTWVVQSGFQCVDLQTGNPTTDSSCAFGPTYNVSDTFTEIPDVNFHITYGSGESATGSFGSENVTLAGVSVNQTVAVVNSATWRGDNVTSGLIGLAFPSLTSAFIGTDPTLDSNARNRLSYSPIFETIANNNLIAPLFSLAILRNISGDSGYLTLGGLPPVNISGEFTSTPIVVTSIQGFPQAYDFYTIAIGGLVVNGRTLSRSSRARYIVDSGTTLNYLPTRFADLVNSAFQPPAQYAQNEGVYIVDCNAAPPSFGINIAGTTFYTNPLDMILLAGTDQGGNNVCISGITDGGNNAQQDVYILGDVFQKNVVTVFDIGAGVLRFAAREDYPSNDPVKA